MWSILYAARALSMKNIHEFDARSLFFFRMRLDSGLGYRSRRFFLPSIRFIR
jgi:hypothetical protein